MTVPSNIPTNRRGLLKALALAPAAAANVKRSAMEMLSKVDSLTVSGHRVVSEIDTTEFHYGSRRDDSPEGKIKSFQKQLQAAAEDLLELNREPPESDINHVLAAVADVDALVSISPAVKLQMIQREATRREIKHRKTVAQRNLAHAKRELGLLGVFLP